MVSASLSILLLVSSAVLISTEIGHTSADQNHLQESSQKKSDEAKVLEIMKRKTLNNLDRITNAVCPFLELIPVCGTLISGVVKFAASEIKGYSDTDFLMDEFENLNAKLDQYRLEQKWDIWSSSVYHKPETDIEVAWDKYKTLLQSLRKAKDDKERGRHMEDFKNAYSKYEPATNKLHKLLSTKGDGFKYPLGDLLAQHAHCHEKTIGHYTGVIIKLIYKGNTMNEFYYKLKEIESEERVKRLGEYAYGAASVMFKVHQQCILTSMDYIKKDVEMLINETQKHAELAKEVWSSLEKDYDRYDWMVVAFVSKKSAHELLKVLNRHILSGFTDVKKDRTSVAVARQVKGTHTKAALVKEAIQKCIGDNILCYEVPEKLSACNNTVEGRKVSETYTAVHAYTRKPDDSHSAQEIPDYDFSLSPEDSSTQIPYIYRGECLRSPLVKGGKFVVLIKSDEEIKAKKPCSDLDCGEKENRGVCVSMKDIFLAMCECKIPYYGQNCEDSLEDYKSYLQGKIQVIDSRRRMVGNDAI